MENIFLFSINWLYFNTHIQLKKKKEKKSMTILEEKLIIKEGTLFKVCLHFVHKNHLILYQSIKHKTSFHIHSFIHESPVQQETR